MAQHRLTGARQVIDAVAHLGRALGYLVRKEAPVEQRPKPSAVDVAWFADNEQRYPLMIFEVESAATNTMANNPAKVFGQPPEQFERPLFFFHIILRTGTETSRLDNLRGTFGSHNYRVYRLDRGMATQLAKDVLSQHRRIRTTVDVGALISTVLDLPVLRADPSAILDHAAELGLHGAYLSDLAELAGVRSDAETLFLRHLRQRLVERRWPRIDTGYPTWLGQSWSHPIHLGLLNAARIVSGEQVLEQLRSWQEHSYFMSQIGPHFGLSRDYDLFILGFSGTLFGLVAALMIDHLAAVAYIAQQLGHISGALASANRLAWLHSTVWGLHIAAATHNEELFDAFRAFANERGGVPACLLYSPPTHVSLDDDQDWHELAASTAKPVPMLRDFLRGRLKHLGPSNDDVSAIRLALAALVTDAPPIVDGDGVLRVLGRHDRTYVPLRSD